MQPRAGRIEGLDVLRGIAAAAVMLHHDGQYYDVLYPGRTPLSWSSSLGPGHFGVELFFIISGFVILMTTEGKKTVREFAISRFARLMPAFLAAMLLATFVFSLWPMLPFLGRPSVGQFLANMTMAPGLFGQKSIDLPYWTLAYELVFYVLMAVALKLRALRSIEAFGLLWVAVGWLYVATMDVRLHHRTTILLLAYYGNFFLAGMCLYRIHSGAARPITYIALACAVLANVRGGGEQAFYAPGYIYLPLAICFTLLVWWASGKRVARWFTWRPLVFLGQISYPLYLLHVVLGFEIIRIGVAHGWSTPQGVLAAVTASLVVATLFHYLIERPGQRWSYALFGARRAKREPSCPTSQPNPVHLPASPMKPTTPTWDTPQETSSPGS
ncbi:MAG TPA: acyltransferase [Reyranella sp.]|nr:acyltransferase [Reyranella sp.]